MYRYCTRTSKRIGAWLPYRYTLGIVCRYQSEEWLTSQCALLRAQFQNRISLFEPFIVAPLLRRLTLSYNVEYAQEARFLRRHKRNYVWVVVIRK